MTRAGLESQERALTASGGTLTTLTVAGSSSGAFDPYTYTGQSENVTLFIRRVSGVANYTVTAKCLKGSDLTVKATPSTGATPLSGCTSNEWQAVPILTPFAQALEFTVANADASPTAFEAFVAEQ